MNILVYNSHQDFAIYISSLAVELNKKHSVTLLTQSNEGEMHADVRKYGVKAFGYNGASKYSIIFYLKQFIFLKKFIKKNKIEVVFSNNHSCNIISVLLQNFTNTRFLICRHHTDLYTLSKNKNAILFDKIINKLGKEFIVPSLKTVKQLKEIEKIGQFKQIYNIPYAYNFNDYPLINHTIVNEIKTRFINKIIFLTIGRLTDLKRIDKIIEEFNNWKKVNTNIVLLILGDGPDKLKLIEQIKSLNLSNDVILLGRHKNVLDYIEVSDLVIHLSESETSCSVIKEAGLRNKPTICCKDVGDFDEYLINNFNTLLVNKYGFEAELNTIINMFCNKPESFNHLGNNLYKTVIENFSTDKIMAKYTKLLQ